MSLLVPANKSEADLTSPRQSQPHINLNRISVGTAGAHSRISGEYDQ